MKSKHRRVLHVATILLSLSSIALITLPAAASVSTDSNPSGITPNGGYIDGGNIGCGSSSAKYVQSTFVLCNDTAGNVWGSLNNGETLCPDGFDVWRFYSESTAPGTVEGYTVSRAYQPMNCKQATGEFHSPAHPDDAVGDVENGAFIDTSEDTTQWPGAVDNGEPVGNPVYYSSITASDITTDATFASTGASCSGLESVGNTAAVDTIFTAMAAGTATATQKTFANAYWTDYQSEGSGEARNYLMNLPETTATMGSPNWSLLASIYGTGNVPRCSSAYQFIPPTTATPNGVEGVCTMPVDTNTAEWENLTNSTNGHIVTAYEQLNNTYGGDRYVAQSGSNSLAAGSGAVAGSNSPAKNSTGFFASWRTAISNEIDHRSTSQPYVGDPYVDENPLDIPYPLASSNDRTAAAAVASGDADCVAFTSSIPAVNAPPTTTTTKPGGTTTTKPGGTTTTTAPVITPPNSGPAMTITPAAPILAAGGALHPNQITFTISPFTCAGAGVCNPDGIGPATLSSVTATPEITVNGGYSDFWISGSPNVKPTNDGGGVYSFTLPPVTAVGVQTYTVDFAYPTTSGQEVTFKVVSGSATATFLVWEKVVVGQTCTTTSAKGKGKTTTTLVTCVPVYGNRQFPTVFTPTIEPAAVTKVVSGTVTPKTASN